MARILSLSFLFIFSHLCLPASALDQPSLAKEQWSELKSGKAIILKSSPNCPFSAGGKNVVGAVLVNHSLSEVWSVVNDPEATPNYLSDMVNSKVVSRDKDSMLVEQGMKVKGFRNPFEYVVRVHPKANEKLTFKMESGKLRAMDGSWHLYSVEGKTLLIYSLFLDPGRLAPQSIVKRSLAKKIPETLLAIQGEIRRRY